MERAPLHNKIRIAVFDDNLFFRESIGILMEGRNDFELTGSFENANDVLHDFKKCSPDVVLMDIEMPGRSGIDALKILKQDYPQLRVLMLTDYDKDEMIIDSVCAGAYGYILKTSPGEKIIEAIHDIHSGNGSLSLAIARKLMDLFAENFVRLNQEDLELLSPREREVLTLLVDGKSYKMIGADLEVCYDTVRAHIKSIYRKLKVSSASGAVAKAMKNHIVTRG